MELLLLLLIFSGLLKGFSFFLGINIPIDLTLLSLILMLFLFLLKNKTKAHPKYFIISIFLLLLFYLWMAVSLLFTPSKSYAYIKVSFFLINIFAFAIPLLYYKLDVKFFVKGFVLISILCGLFYLPFQFLYQVGEMSSVVDEGNSSIHTMYLAIGELLGLSFLFCTTQERLWQSKMLQSLITLICIVVLALIGARGPLLFALLLALMYMMFSGKIKLTSIFNVNFFLRICLGLIIIIALYLKNAEYLDVLIERTVSRFMVLGESGNSNSSALARVNYLNISIEHIFKNPFVFLFGNGVGSFGILVLHEDIRAYPHNIILEIFFEFGLIGLMIFMLWIIYSLKFIKSKSSHISIFILSYLLLNLLKSSSLVDIRLSFIILSIYMLGKKVQKMPQSIV